MLFGRAARLRLHRKPSRFCSLRALARYRQGAPARVEIATRQRERAEASRRETVSRILGPLREPPSLYPLERPSVSASFIADFDQPLDAYASPPSPEAFVSSLSSLLSELSRAGDGAQAGAASPGSSGAVAGSAGPLGGGSVSPSSGSLPREADAVARLLLGASSSPSSSSAAATSDATEFSLDALDAARRAFERLHRDASDRALLDPLAPTMTSAGDVWATARQRPTPDDPLYRYATLADEEEHGAGRAITATAAATAGHAGQKPRGQNVGRRRAGRAPRESAEPRDAAGSLSSSPPSSSSSLSSSSSFSSALSSYASLSPEASPSASRPASPTSASALPGAARRARGAALRAAMRGGGFYQLPRGPAPSGGAAGVVEASEKSPSPKDAQGRGRGAAAPRPAAPAAPRQPPSSMAVDGDARSVSSRLVARETRVPAAAVAARTTYAPLLQFARAGEWADASGGAAAAVAGSPAVHVTPLGDVAVRVEMADVDGSWIDEEEDERAKAKLAEARAARGGRRRKGGRQ